MSKFNDFAFSSNFASDLESFIGLKHGLGNVYYGASIVLKSFDTFCLDKFENETILSKEIVMAWYKRCIERSVKPKTLRLSMTPISHFAKYLCDKGDLAYIFPVSSLPKEKQYTPHIYG